MPDPAQLKYRAFLSYAHTDKRWATWLHGRLEAFPIDKDLRKQVTRLGPLPDSLKPIFLDRGNFAGGSTLTEATLAALDASAALIVLCSTAAAGRPAVQEEVRLFRFRHPERPIIPAIIEGQHPDYFPPALRFALNTDGTVGSAPLTVLGTDLRESGDGRELGLAKVVAGLLGFDNADDIYRRSVRAQRRANQLRAAAAAVFVGVTAGGGFFYWRSTQLGTTVVQQQEMLDAASTLADQMLGINPAAAATPGTKQNLIESLKNLQAKAAAGDVDAAKVAQLLHDGKGVEAVALLTKAADEREQRLSEDHKKDAKAYRDAAAIAAVADPGKARALYAKAARLDPDDLEGVFQDAEFQRDAGALDVADAAYRRVLAIGKTGTDDDRLMWSHFGLGDILVARGALTQATTEYQLGSEVASRVANSNAGDSGWQRELSVSYNKVGDVQEAQGNLAGALASYQDSLAIRDRLAKSDLSNTGWQRDLFVSLWNVANVERGQGKLDAALETMRKGEALMTPLAATDAKNANWQRDLTTIDEFIGDVQIKQGKMPEALKSYQDSLAIRDRLAKTDPGNAGWQRDLSVAYEKVGQVEAAQNDKQGALKSYQDSLAIAGLIANSAPSNAVWQSDLAAAKSFVGDALLAQGDRAAALGQYQEDRDILFRLAKSDVTNTGWQRDLSVAYNKVGDVLAEQGNLADARKSYQDCYAIRDRLAKSDLDNADWQRDLSVSHMKLADVAAKTGDKATARAEFVAAREISARLIVLAPGNADWKNDVAWIDQQLTELGK